MAPLQLDVFSDQLNEVIPRNNRVCNRRILLIYNCRLTNLDIKGMINVEYDYTYYNGKTYIVCNVEDQHLLVRSFEYCDPNFDITITPIIKVVRSRSNQRVITELMNVIKSEEHQSDKNLKLIILALFTLIVVVISIL